MMQIAGGQGGALAQPEFGSSVNSIPTRAANFAHHITACPPKSEKLMAFLQLYSVSYWDQGVSEVSQPNDFIHDF